MLTSNVEKIKSLLQKPHSALPMSTDLPRLANIRIFNNGKEIPLSSGELQPSTIDKLYYIFTTLSEILVSPQYAQETAAHFKTHLSEATSSSGTITKNQVADFLKAIGGDDSPVVTVLKPVNQASVSPAIIELKTVLGLENMTKDVRNSWFFVILVAPDHVIVQSKKRDQCIKNNFQLEWVLSFTLDRTSPSLPCTDVRLFVEDLVFSAECLRTKVEKKEEVKRILKKYTADDVLEASDNKAWDATSPPPAVIALSVPPQQQPPPHSPRVATATVVTTIANDKPASPRPAPSKQRTYSNGDSYFGDVDKYGIRHGRGVYTNASGDVYEGEYKNGLKSGYGIYRFRSGAKFEGTFDAGVMSRGTYTFPNGDTFTGEFKNNVFDGVGRYVRATGEAYDGSFKGGQRVGKGILQMDRDQYDGEFMNDQMDGTGKYTFSNGDTYLGSFKEGRFHGHGEYRFSAPGKTVIGEFLEGTLVKVISVE